MTYDEKTDVARVHVRPTIATEDVADSERLDADRFVRYDADGRALTYEFLNARRLGIRVDDLEDRAALAALFLEVGFSERDWVIQSLRTWFATGVTGTPQRGSWADRRCACGRGLTAFSAS